MLFFEKNTKSSHSNLVFLQVDSNEEIFRERALGTLVLATVRRTQVAPSYFNDKANLKKTVGVVILFNLRTVWKLKTN